MRGASRLWLRQKSPLMERLWTGLEANESLILQRVQSRVRGEAKHEASRTGKPSETSQIWRLWTLF